MQILDNLIIISLIVTAFCLGMYTNNRYSHKAMLDQKDALERQYMRLRACADADDPCKPYLAYGARMPMTSRVPYSQTYEIQPQPITEEFMHELKSTGKAKTAFRKSDVVK